MIIKPREKVIELLENHAFYIPIEFHEYYFIINFIMVLQYFILHIINMKKRSIFGKGNESLSF